MNWTRPAAEQAKTPNLTDKPAGPICDVITAIDQACLRLQRGAQARSALVAHVRVCSLLDNAVTYVDVFYITLKLNV